MITISTITISFFCCVSTFLICCVSTFLMPSVHISALTFNNNILEKTELRRSHRCDAWNMYHQQLNTRLKVTFAPTLWQDSSGTCGVEVHQRLFENPSFACPVTVLYHMLINAFRVPTGWSGEIAYCRNHADSFPTACTSSTFMCPLIFFSIIDGTILLGKENRLIVLQCPGSLPQPCL